MKAWTVVLNFDGSAFPVEHVFAADIDGAKEAARRATYPCDAETLELLGEAEYEAELRRIPVVAVFGGHHWAVA